MKVSVISATYNRAELLDNALVYYAQQTLPFEEWEYLICDDASQDNTKEVVERWIQKGLPLRYFTSADLGLPKEPGVWRDGCKLRNALSTHAFGEVLVATHPEIIPPADALEAMYTAAKDHPKDWITAIPYWLPPVESEKFKRAWAWKKDILHLRVLPGFYDPDWPSKKHSPGAIDYANQNQEIRTTWESEVFWAMTMAQWRWMGGFREFDVWGAIDMDFLSRRKALSIKTFFAKSDDSPHQGKVLMVYHQFHESKRDMDAAIKAVRQARYNTPEDARKAGGLFPIYNHGHRERATSGEVVGILGDHIARYKFAALFAEGKRVLDIPCGTGYGSTLLPTVGSYFGIDADSESIFWARDHYARAGRAFIQGDMRHIPPWDDFATGTNVVDLLLCFEGIEHIPYEDHQAFVREMHRVLRPGGTFILSTPQKGAARGTPWDRFILTPDQLLHLFTGPDWTKLDWFYQMSYGAERAPIGGKPPRNAEIMILGGTCVK